MNKLSDKTQKKIITIFEEYIKEANNIKNINRWTTKKSISAKVLNPQRANEQKILDAVSHLNPREGDKYHLYQAVDGQKQAMLKGEPVTYANGEPKMVKNTILKVADNWTNDHDAEHYTQRVYKTLQILENILDLELFTKYHLKSKRDELEELLNEERSID